MGLWPKVPGPRESELQSGQVCTEHAHALAAARDAAVARAPSLSCYAALGQRVQAMRQYLLCERLLRETFDAVPEPSTRALYDRLRLDPASARTEP